MTDLLIIGGGAAGLMAAGAACARGLTTAVAVERVHTKGNIIQQGAVPVP